jgi:hypothetical protein
VATCLDGGRSTGMAESHSNSRYTQVKMLHSKERCLKGEGLGERASHRWPFRRVTVGCTSAVGTCSASLSACDSWACFISLEVGCRSLSISALQAEVQVLGGRVPCGLLQDGLKKGGLRLVVACCSQPHLPHPRLLLKQAQVRGCCAWRRHVNSGSMSGVPLLLPTPEWVTFRAAQWMYCNCSSGPSHHSYSGRKREQCHGGTRRKAGCGSAVEAGIHAAVADCRAFVPFYRLCSSCISTVEWTTVNYGLRDSNGSRS